MQSESAHPADILADLRAFGHDPARDAELCALLASSREHRVGDRFHAVITRHPHGDVVEVEPVPSLERYLELLSGPLVVGDTETTGLHHTCGDKVTSVALLPGRIEGSTFVEGGEPFHAKVNPGRASSADALAVHGMDEDELAGEPPFRAIAQEVGRRLDGAVFVAHNAPFDVGFLDLEFEATPFLGPSDTCAAIVDTRVISKVLWPDLPASLDPLAERLGIDRSARDAKHEALLDTLILARCLRALRSEIRRRLGLDAPPPGP